ncbi:CheR family methyltransferase [Kinneretia aquatilis]|jgi:chemotaxis protein methyltransferase CheR|uniref:CheR family methyltransferase n=1 Tax=Kinneretia aquatilis TaxID=2070761 RepID=UPI0014950855|nr:CheR family methyltransferase [Paucibacter aquatile]WIV98901.1 CheR family methyltransferase [Paucibacter aquatile]
MSQLTTDSFKAITELFHRISGIKLVESKHALVQSRLQKLSLEAGETDINVFVQKMVRGQMPEELLVSVVDKLTTNETYFFREPQHFEDLVRRAQGQGDGGEFLVWSGASSSGEEAYSIAMVLADKLGMNPSSRPWSIRGTDLSTAVVESARQGLYPMDRARNVPADYLRRFCLQGFGPYEGQLLINRELRSRVQFQCANLMQPLPPLPMFDVIFLRNVLIYFDGPAKTAIVSRVMERLKPGGVLYPGHAESLASLGLPLKAIAPAIYQHA